MTTENVKLTDIRENPDNPRTITRDNTEKLVKSLLVFPRMMALRPIVVDEHGIVLGGNMRLHALALIADMTGDEIRAVLASDKRLANEQVDALADYWADWQKSPTAIIARAEDLTEGQKREFIIKDNASFGEWNADALASWDSLPLEEWGLPSWVTGMSCDPTEGESGESEDSEEGEGESTAAADKVKDFAESVTLKVTCKDVGERVELFSRLVDEGYTCEIC